MAGDRLEGEEKLIILVVFLLTGLDFFENDEVERRVSGCPDIYFLCHLTCPLNSVP